MKTCLKHYVLAVALLLVSGSGIAQTTAVDYYNRGLAKQAKGDLDGAIADHTRAIELDPKYVPAYNDRGTAKQDKGDLDGAIADYTRAIELHPKYVPAYNNMAWLLATAADAAVRDGRKAVEYARLACQITDFKAENHLDTLAAAYAEAGDYEQAASWQQKAITASEDNAFRTKAQERLTLYRNGKPYHETLHTGKARSK
jgi:tetratricopeptide (TPR) repeat protein